jgi:hypothetical protein
MKNLDLLVANIRSWYYAHHINSEAVIGGIILAIIIAVILLKFFKPPKV